MHASQSRSDAELLSLIGEHGDDRALAVLYDRYRVLAFSVSYRILDDASEAEEALQESFISIWRGAGFDPRRGAARSWILGVVRNRSIDALRRNAKTKSNLSRWSEDEIERAPSTDAVPAEQAVAREDARLLRAALSSLPLEQAAVLEFAYFKGLSQQEISRRLSLPIGTVKSRARLGLEKLRRSLTRDGFAAEFDPERFDAEPVGWSATEVGLAR